MFLLKDRLKSRHDHRCLATKFAAGHAAAGQEVNFLTRLELARW
jgi:hypothetical protein